MKEIYDTWGNGQFSFYPEIWKEDFTTMHSIRWKSILCTMIVGTLVQFRYISNAE